MCTGSPTANGSASGPRPTTDPTGSAPPWAPCSTRPVPSAVSSSRCSCADGRGLSPPVAEPPRDTESRPAASDLDPISQPYHDRRSAVRRLALQTRRRRWTRRCRGRCTWRRRLRASWAPALLRQIRCGNGWDDIDDPQMRPIRAADSRGDQAADVVGRYPPGRPHDRGPHAGPDELGVQTTDPRVEHPVRAVRRCPDQFRAEQHHITTAVVDHRRNELGHKVLRADPGSVSNTGTADQDVGGTYQVVGGLHETIDGKRVGEIQVGGEHRSASGPKTGSDFLADVGPAPAHQYQVPTGRQPGRRRQTDGGRGFGDNDRPGLAHDGRPSISVCPAKLWWSTTSGEAGKALAGEHGSDTKTA